VTEGCGKLVPDSVTSHSSIADVAGLMGATLRAPIASSSQMLGLIGAAVNSDVHADVEIEHDLTLEAGSEARPTQPPHPSLVVDVPSGYPEHFETFGTPDTVDVADIFSVDVTPLASISTSVDVTSCPDMSVDVAASVSVADTGSYLSSIRDPSFVNTAAGAYGSFQNPSLAPNVGRASLGDTTPGTHPLMALKPTSFGDTASSGFPLTALGRYTEPDDSLAQAQDQFWTHTTDRDRGVSSGSDLSLDTYAELDSRSALDCYFAEVGTRKDNAIVSASTQVGPSPWTLMTRGLTPGGSRFSSDPSLVLPQYKKPRTPPPRTVVATVPLVRRCT